MIIPEDFYRRIVAVLPIACVDLLVVDGGKRVLLVKRRNEPAKGLWWVPGGRVHFGELRAAAALRKLREECGLRALAAPAELTTEDVILPNGQGGSSHVICTVFRCDVEAGAPVVLDAQSEASDWRSAAQWLAAGVHPYVAKLLALVG